MAYVVNVFAKPKHSSILNEKQNLLYATFGYKIID